MITLQQVGHTMFSTPLQEYFKSNLLLFCERQLHIREVIHQYSTTAAPSRFDLSTGTLIFNDLVFKNIQVLGSYSFVHQTWLWSWSNPSLLPEELLDDAYNAKEFGQRHNIPEFVNSSHISMDKASALALAMVAVDVVGAEAFYTVDIAQGEGIAFISIRDEKLYLPTEKFVFDNFVQLVSSVIESYPHFIPNQIQIIEDYCTGRGEQQWNWEMDYNPREDTQGMDINQLQQDVGAIGMLRCQKGQILARIVYDENTRILGFHNIHKPKGDTKPSAEPIQLEAPR